MGPTVNPVGKAKMPTLAAGNKPTARSSALGFTLIELMVILVIMAMATAGVLFYIGDGQQAQLEREGQRLAALLESARHTSQTQGAAVTWQVRPGGFEFRGLNANGQVSIQPWLHPNTSTTDPQAQLILGPEPVMAPQQITLIDLSQPQHRLRISSDGLHPFAMRSEAP